MQYIVVIITYDDRQGIIFACRGQYGSILNKEVSEIKSDPPIFGSYDCPVASQSNGIGFRIIQGTNFALKGGKRQETAI